MTDTIPNLLKLAGSICQTYLSDLIKTRHKELLDEKKKKYERMGGFTEQEIRNLKLEENELIRNIELCTKENVAQKRIGGHIQQVRDWASSMKLRDMPQKKRIKDVYINLDTYLMPRSYHFEDSEKRNIKTLEDALFDVEEHCIVLGAPGAGKTTSMKKMCLDSLSGSLNSRTRFPILIRFRDLKDTGSEHLIIEELAQLISFDLSYTMYTQNRVPTSTLRDWYMTLFSTYVDSLRPLIILDGFDEIPPPLKKEALLAEVRQLCRALKQSKVILTCRTGEFNHTLENSVVYEIASLNEKQIWSFVSQWTKDEQKTENLVRQIASTPFKDTAMKPLNLAHLCTIFDRTGRVPNQPKKIYKKVVNLMLEEWDEQRSVLRTIDNSESLDAEGKFELLANLACLITTRYKVSIFTIEQFNEVYRAVYQKFNLEKNQGKVIAQQLESETGLLLQSGYDKYEFAHKSIQEYLTADYIVKYPNLDAVRPNMEVLPAELAIATAISSNPTLYLTEIVLGLFNYATIAASFFDAFITRLELERPAFEYNEDLTITILSLLSYRAKDKRMIKIANSLSKFMNADDCFQYYDFEDNYDPEMKGNEEWMFLILISKHKKYRLKHKLRVPKNDATTFLIE